jgi:hypothetical protein
MFCYVPSLVPILSQVQILSSEPRSQTPSVYILPFSLQSEFYVHKITVKLQSFTLYWRFKCFSLTV